MAVREGERNVDAEWVALIWRERSGCVAKDLKKKRRVQACPPQFVGEV